VGVFSRSEYEHDLLFDIHHIIFDGTSMDVLIHDFLELHNGGTLKPLEVRYRDFTAWQKKHFESGIIKKAGDYWLNLYSDGMEGEVPRLNLPTDFPRPDVMSYEGGSVRFSLDKDRYEALKKMALENGVSLFMLLLAIYNVFLSKLSGQEDIISAVVVSGRNHRDTENVIGVFINMLALRNEPREEKRFPGFLEEVGKSVMAAFENRDYPFEELIEQVPGTRDVSRHPLADVGFTLQNAGVSMDKPYEDTESELRLVSMKSERKSARNDLNLEGFEIRDSVEFEFQYRAKLFKEETIVRFARYFETLISEILDNPGQKIGDMELLTGEEKERLLKRFNNTVKIYAEEKTVFQLFEDRAEQDPEAVAVRSTVELQNIYDRLKPEDVEVELTYEALNERANQLAHLLRERGVQRESIVGLMVQHPLEKVIGIWGILKSGGAYLPIDPLYPSTVINSILADSRVAMLVSESGLEETLSEINIPVSTSLLFIDEPGESDSLENPGCVNAMSDLAYIIYTSGTTGRAKGTSIEHKGIANYARWRIEYFGFTGKEVTLQPLTYSFDSFCANFYAALLSGSELVVVPDNRRLDYDYVVGLVREYSVTNVCFAPGLYNALLEAVNGDDLNSLKLVVLAGEAAGPDLVRKSKEKLPHTRLANEYGPTEATVAAAAHPQVEETATAIIGTPISNAQVYILDDSFKPVLPGMVGEIFVGGTGVARGYLNSPELTAERFDQDFQDYQDKKGNNLLKGIDKNPLTSLPLYPSTSLYRTGDLGRWMPDGNIEFLGRKDFQVKIRGHRIELEQVESILAKHEQIKDVLVDVKGKADNRYICAYIVPCDPQGFYTAGIKDYLNERLPYYMVPSHFMQIEKFPLTRNGKINRKALPDPAFSAKDGYTAPRNHVENKLVHIWAEVLNIDPDVIGIDSNFFDLGGHSLRATMLVSKVQKEMEFKIPITGFFDSPTIRGLSRLMKISPANTPARDFTIEPAAKKEYYSLSSVQKRLYLLQMMNPQNTAYNNIQPVLMQGRPGKEKLAAAFKLLIKRHEGLRTSYEMIKGEPVQKVHEDVPFEIESINPEPNCRETGEPGIEAIVRDYRRPFDLTRAPLFRVGLGQIHEEKFLLILETHHIISDILSHGIFIRDFTTLTTGGEIPPLKLQYKDFSEWQNRDHVKKAMKQQEDYWLREFDREIPLLNLPVDYPRPEKRNLEGHSVDFILQKEESEALKKLARKEDVTPFMLLLSIFNVFLSKICSQEEIVVGIPTAGRTHPDLNNIMGMFANTLVLLNSPLAEKTFRDFLMEVKQRALKAYENQDFPFEQLVNQVAFKREPGRNPMFDVMFNYRGADTVEETSAAVIPGLTLTLRDSETSKSKFDMTLYVQDNGEMFHVMIAYSTQLFKKETIEHFADYFRKIIGDVGENTTRKIANIEIMAREKIEKISARFSENLEDE
jgi:amino acid adenylation domain-containing protein